MANSYYKWSTDDDITLFLQLVSSTGLGVTGATPEIAIRRVRATHGGALDGYWWNGSAFQNSAIWLSMVEFDSVNYPGLYSYLFEQTLISSEWVYFMYYRNTTGRIGFSVETHIITDEISIPTSSPAVPILPGETIMGKLAAMETPTGLVALANADAVWDETLNQHLNPGSTGEALSKIATAIGTNGAWQIDITVTDESFVALQGVQIDVYDSTNTNFLSRIFTDISGQVSIALDTGTYALRMYKTGYSFTVPEMLVVSADASVSFEGTGLIVITPPSAPDLCVIFGTVRDAAGRAISNARVEAYATTPQIVSGTQKHEMLTCAVTDANGYFEIELVKNTEVNFRIEETGLDVTRTVPNTSSQDVTTWT